MRKVGSLIAILMFAGAGAATPVNAQEIIPSVRERINVNVANERREAPVRVQVGINFFLPGPSGDSADANKLRKRARQTVYEMASEECQLVEKVLARTCRLEAINVNVGRQQMVGQIEGITVNGNFTLQAMPK